MVSVVIPTLNEAEVLRPTLERACAARRSEIIVADGHSTDGTHNIALCFAAKILVSGERHRAIQMNLGATHASGDILLFLHADTILPLEWLGMVQEALADEAVIGGAFTRRFQSASLLLRLTCLLAELRNKTIGWHLGDQGIFVRRKVFDRLNGFRVIKPFEDLDFSRRMAKTGKIVTLHPPVISSARRFCQRGPLLTTISDVALTVRYALGANSGHA